MPWATSNQQARVAIECSGWKQKGVSHTHTHTHTYTHPLTHSLTVWAHVRWSLLTGLAKHPLRKVLADAGAIYIYIYIYIYTYTYTCMHTYIHTYIHTCIHTYRHTFIHTYIHTYIHTHRCSCPGIPAYMSRYSAPECRCCLPRISNYTRPIFHDRAKTARNVTAQLSPFP